MHPQGQFRWIEAENAITAAIGSGGGYALAAARALHDIDGFDAMQIGEPAFSFSQNSIMLFVSISLHAYTGFLKHH